MKKFILISILVPGLAVSASNVFRASGVGPNMKEAQWAAIKDAFLTCGGAARNVGKWDSEKSEVDPRCPGQFQDPSDCLPTYKVSSEFECL